MFFAQFPFRGIDALHVLGYVCQLELKLLFSSADSAAHHLFTLHFIDGDLFRQFCDAEERQFELGLLPCGGHSDWFS